MGRHPRAEQAAAQMVALDVLRHIVWAIGYWLLMPAWPLVASYTKGISATASARSWPSSSKRPRPPRPSIRQKIAAERSGGDQWRPRAVCASRSPAARRLSATIARRVMAAARKALSAIRTCATIPGCGAERSMPSSRPFEHGISADDPKTRSPGAQMPAFGRIGPARREPQIGDVAEYVLSLSGRADDEASGANAARRSSPTTARPVTGRKARATRRSVRRTLTDELWLYAGDKATIAGTISRRQRRRDARLGDPARSGDDQGARHLRPFAGRGPIVEVHGRCRGWKPASIGSRQSGCL